ncbi:MAG: chorismate lyase [Gammaproteobacteria bacterium]|nr:MAG: chorismate lyase [Gammaproteobacteria bacterium]
MSVFSPWRTPRLVTRSHIPATLWSWLFDSASLTRRLLEVCEGAFEVRVLRQGWQRPLPDESRALGLRAAETVFVREVYLLCHGEPWVFARTVIPRATLSGKYRRLTRLGNRSLGAVLFADKTMRRGDLEIACLMRGHALFENATRGLAARPPSVWGRRSLFQLGGKPLLLSEIFLHDMSSCKPKSPKPF